MCALQQTYCVFGCHKRIENKWSNVFGSWIILEFAFSGGLIATISMSSLKVTILFSCIIMFVGIALVRHSCGGNYMFVTRQYNNSRRHYYLQNDVKA